MHNLPWLEGFCLRGLSVSSIGIVFMAFFSSMYKYSSWASSVKREDTCSAPPCPIYETFGMGVHMMPETEVIFNHNTPRELFTYYALVRMRKQ